MPQCLAVSARDASAYSSIRRSATLRDHPYPFRRGRAAAMVAEMSGQSILRFFLLRIVAGSLIGVLYAGAWYGSPVGGGLAGALCAASFTSLERFVLKRNAGGLIRPLPFLAYFVLRSVLYVGVIVFVIVVVSEASGAGFAGVRTFDLIVALVLAVGVILFLRAVRLRSMLTSTATLVPEQRPSWARS